MGQNEMIITHTDVGHQPETWPAKNRKPTALPPWVTQIVSTDGIEEFDPDGILIEVLDDQRDFVPLPDERSELSGEPAIIYRSGDLELRLSPPELRRMIARDLQNAEFCTLRDRYGMATEWHEYIYDPVAGARRRPEAEETISDEERAEFLSIRREIGREIDPVTAEVDWNYGVVGNPYGIYHLPPEQCEIERVYFARSPGSDIWVSFGDLPDSTRSALWEKYKSKIRFPAVIPMSYRATGSRNVGNETIITTEVVLGGDEKKRVIDWYLTEADGEYRITDMVVDGVSKTAEVSRANRLAASLRDGSWAELSLKLRANHSGND